MAKLTAESRKKLDTSQFAIPEDRAYPIHDESHARNALARVQQHGTPSEKRRVYGAVKRKYPSIEIESKPGPTRAKDGAVVLGTNDLLTYALS